MRHWKAALLAVCMLLSLTGCSKDDGEMKEGRVGETMKTHFFDYTVNDAYTCDSYEDYTPSAGGKILVVDVTVKNTFSKSVEMYDTDFFVLWDSENEDDVRVPITTDPETWEELDVLSQDQLPGTYELGVNQERTGLLVYDVPAEVKDFTIAYLEQFDDDTEGDLHAVFFTPDIANV